MTTAPFRPSISAPALPAEWLTTGDAVPRLARHIVARIRAEVPEYALDPTGEISAETQASVREALRMFMRTLTGTGELSTAQADVFRRLGRIEALSGRSHDTLQAAYRVASQTVMHHLLDWERQFRVSQKSIAELSAAVFAFIDELATLSAEGYAAAQTDRSDHARRRALLLALLLQRGSVPRKAIEDAASRVDWPVPAQCVIAEVRSALVLPESQLAALAARLFGPHTLAGQISGRNMVVAPAPLDAPTLRDGLAAAGSGIWVFVGPAVPVTDAGSSSRLARRAANLREARTLAIGGLLICDEHLLDLYCDAGSDVALAMRRVRLAPLLALTSAKRLKYGRLLSAWLEYGSTSGSEPGVLDKHRQTLRYQTARLEEMFGPDLHDRSIRLELMIALRAALPDWERAVSGAGRAADTARGADFVPEVPTQPANSSHGPKNVDGFQHARNASSPEAATWLTSLTQHPNGKEPE